AGIARLLRALVAAIIALDRARDVDAAELLDAVVRHAVAERVAPGIGEGPKDGRHVRAHRLAFGSRRALAAAALELGEHRRIADRGRVDIADALRGHRVPPGGSGWRGPQAANLGAGMFGDS